MYVIPEVNAAGRGIPTDSPQQSLKDMLCGIQGFSPTGLTGVLPATASASATASAAAAATCAPPKLGLFAHKGVAFQPVVIPVVFHCEWAATAAPDKAIDLELMSIVLFKTPASGPLQLSAEF
jgi:hypothetical protein